MRYKVPNIPTFSGLYGLESRVQSIQQRMVFVWLDYAFGLCKRTFKEDDVIPVCFANNTSDNIDMRPWPDDSWRSYAFWDLTGEQEFNYGENYGLNKYPFVTAPVACIFLLNLNKISSDTFNVTHSRIRAEIINFFGSVQLSGILQITNISEKDIEDIFIGYTLNDPQLILRDGISAFRIDGTITYKHECRKL